jgi:hypothetical protein
VSRKIFMNEPCCALNSSIASKFWPTKDLMQGHIVIIARIPHCKECQMASTTNIFKTRNSNGNM